MYLAVKFGPVGFIEELLFRGFIWDRCREAGLRPVLVVAVDEADMIRYVARVRRLLSEQPGLLDPAVRRKRNLPQTDSALIQPVTPGDDERDTWVTNPWRMM